MDTVFGDRLKASRRKKGLVQKQLADAVGVGQAAIANYEKGARFPGKETLKRLTEILGVSLDYLMAVSNLEGLELGSGAAKPIPGEEGVFSARELMTLLLEDHPAHSVRYIQDRFVGPSRTLADIYEEALAPTLALTGSLWQSGALSVADEHIISAKIRELVVILGESGDGSTPAPIHPRKTWMGFAAPGDEHDIAVLMLSRLMRQRGWNAVFLGLCPPLPSLLDSIRHFRPNAIFVSITIASCWNSLEAYLLEILKHTNFDCRIVVGGLGIELLRSEIESLGLVVAETIRQAVVSAEDNKQ